MRNRTFDNITDYLSGNLAGEALARFESELQNNPELAAEVDLYRDMSAALTPSPEDALRKNLAALGRKYAPLEPAKQTLQVWWITGGLLLAVILCWWTWPAGQAATMPAQPSILPAPPPTDPGKANAPVVPSADPDPEEKLPVTHDKKAVPMAAAFLPNPRLEAMINSQYRSNDYRFSILRPVPNATIYLKNGQAAFSLSGTLETTVKQENETFRALLVSNKQADYENSLFVFSRNLVFEKKNNLLVFNISASLQLQPGLYYLLIEGENSGMVQYVGKLNIK